MPPAPRMEEVTAITCATERDAIVESTRLTAEKVALVYDGVCYPV